MKNALESKSRDAPLEKSLEHCLQSWKDLGSCRRVQQKKIRC